MNLLVAYDIADDRRRTRVADTLSALGPRVQLSVFEVAVDSPQAVAALQARLAALIDDDEDQIRLYDINGPMTSRRRILGNRRLEERMAYLLI